MVLATRSQRGCRMQHRPERVGRKCSRACSANSSGNSDSGFPFASASHRIHYGGAIRHIARINRQYWPILTWISGNDKRYKHWYSISVFNVWKWLQSACHNNSTREDSQEDKTYTQLGPQVTCSPTTTNPCTPLQNGVLCNRKVKVE